MPSQPPQYSVGMVFGVFDGFHPGHQHFLSEAAKHCQKLIVVVARPEIVRALKERTPRYTCEDRIQKIHEFNDEWEVIPGDTKIGTWTALKKYHPEVVLLGYDQVNLGKELEQMKIPVIFIDALLPHKYKSSLLLKR